MNDTETNKTAGPILSIAIGLKPDSIEASTKVLTEPTQDNLPSYQLVLANHSTFDLANIKITASYYDDAGRYLDFEDIDFEDVELEPLRGLENESHTLLLNPPTESVSATLDITGDVQTFFKRHWRVISTVAVVVWGLIILMRRLGPSFTE